MPNLIENAARGAVSSLPAVGTNQQAEQAQRLRGADLIKNLTGGGLALGAGVSASVALLNYLKSLSTEADMQDPSRLDDETLYIPEPHKKQAADEGVNKWMAPGLAITGGVLGAGAGYAAVQAVYNKLQRKHLEKMLDQAQSETLTAVGEEAQQKSAGDAKLSLSDIVTAFPVATPLLVALASGGVASAALNKAFPVIKKPKSKYPRRIRVVSPDGDVSMPDEEADTMKMASVSDLLAERDLEHAGLEFLTMVTDGLAIEKKALCLTSDILNKAAKEGLSGMNDIYMDYGLPALAEAVKGASDVPAASADKLLAAMALFKHATLGPAVASLAASEYLDMVPEVASLVERGDHNLLDKSAGIAPLLHLAILRPFAQEAVKSANMELLQQLIASIGMTPQPTAGGGGAMQQPTAAGHGEVAEERDAAMTSDVAGSMTEDSEGDSGDTDGSNDESQANNDVVDTFMESPHQLTQHLPQR